MASGKEGLIELSMGSGLLAAEASEKVGGTWPYSPRVGLASGAAGGRVLEVPCLTGHTVAISLPSFTWKEKGKATRASEQREPLAQL